MRFVSILWLLLITGLSLAPLGVKTRLHTMGTLHIAGHFAIFFLTVLVFSSAFSSLPGKLLAALLSFWTAIGLEGLENLVYHAGFEWKDVVTDSGGVLVGLGLAILVWLLTPKVNEAMEH